MSLATITPANFELGPMRVKWNSVDLGGVKGVSVSVEDKLSPLMAENFGTGAMDFAFSGREMKIKMTLLETGSATKSNWTIAFPFWAKTTGGGQTKFDFTNALTTRLLPLAESLILHPIHSADAELNHDWKFYKAACMSATEVKYGPEEQTGLAVEFFIFPDTSLTPISWGVYGDPAVA